ncbi:MAG: carboxypeptidase regulatory-like domain-containing protein [Melioribacteraceae bacterium]|nr:carboxypeptidase regulatory-like domain-containing protein [Melioribacteraceae bacterium]
MINKFLLTLLFFLFSLTLTAQTIFVVPQGYNSSGTSLSLKILFHPDSLIVLSWNGDINSQNVKIKVGTTSGNYNLTNSSFPMNVNGVPVGGGAYIQSFKGSSTGLSTGRYYGILTSSTADNINDIINDSGKEYSNEFQFVVTATSGAVASSPIGTILESTPTFRWSSVPGVVSYWLLVSSTPFEVKTDDDGNLKIEGANLIWNYTTNETSAQYGDVNPLNPYDNGVPAPLFPSETYNYVILNLYEENNPIYASPVISGINAFVFESDQSNFPVPDLLTPANNSTFDNEATITFTWEDVDWAVGYSFHLFERVTSFGGNEQTIDIPIYSATTTNNLIDFAAKSKLNKGTYVWFVIPSNSQGAGSVSETFEFFYNKILGVFRLQAYSTLDNSGLLNYEGRAIAVVDGVTPANPYLVSDAQTYTDSIALGTYQFVGSKTGFQDATLSVAIDENATASNPQLIRFPLTPLPATFSGTVSEDGSSLPLANTLVEIINNATSVKKSALTNSNGIYSLSTTIGQYTLRVSKAGYISADEQTINAASGQINISTIYLVKDEVSVSGKISNTTGQPIQLASVTATKGNTTQQKNSSSDGSYNFVLSSGNWIIDVNKTGFISPTPLSISLSTNDNLQNQNLILIPRANQVSGVVSKVIKNSDGSISKIPYNEILVTADPTIGTPITENTNSSGNFTFSLPQETYTFSVSKNGYTASEPLQLTLGIGQTIDNLLFDLTPNPASVSGKITTTSGGAADGVKVEVFGVASTQSDLNGLYTLSLPEGTHEISVSKSGFIPPVSQTLSLDPGDNLTGINFELSPNAGVISGKISSSGVALSGALVKAVSGGMELLINSDVDGNYSFNVQPNAWDISVSKSGFITSSSSSINIGAGQQSSNNDFSLVQNIATVSGIVKVSGNPERNVAVSIYNKATNVLVINTVTDVGGQFIASLEANIEYKIEVSKSGYSSSTESTSALSPGSSTLINFEILENPSSFSGKIISNNNDVIKDAILNVHQANGSIVQTLLSNDNGEYSVGLASGDYKVVVSKAGYRSDSSDVSLSVGQNLQNIDLTLNENFAIITGTVTAAGVGLDDVLVNLISPIGGKSKYTLGDGTFLINKLVGSAYQISFSKAGYSDTTIADYEILDGESKIFNISLEILNGKIVGKILTSSGSPVNDATVKAILDNGSEYNSSSNANGEYTIPSLKSGNYKVSASKTNYRTALEVSVTISPSSLNAVADVNDLKENIALLSGVAKDSGTSETLLGVSIHLIGANDSYSVTSNNLGEYQIPNIAPGDYTLTGTLDNYSTSTTTISILESTSTISKDILLAKNSGSITGKVVNQFNEALTISANVIASSQTNMFTVQTGNDGVFAFTEVPPDTYIVKTDIYADGYINGEISNIIVTANAQTDVGNLTVNVNTSKIVGNVGTDNATITLSDNGNVIGVKQSSVNGDYNFNFLSDGSYVVKPAKNGFIFTPTSKSITLGVNDEKIVDFTSVSSIGDIVVSVEDESNQPLSQVSISLVNADTNYVKSGTTNALGIAEFLDIPSDTYILTPSLANYTPSPLNKSVTLSSSDSLNVNFTLTKNEAKMSGTVFKLVAGGTNTTLGNVIISAKSKDAGNRISSEVYRTLSDSLTGKYELDNLPKKEFTITASRIGFESQSVHINFADNINVTQDYVLTPSIVNLNGKVISKNIEDVDNLSLKAVSSYGEFYSTTNSNGNYTFSELPIDAAENDTTLYQISLTDDNLILTKLVVVPGSEINSTITLPDFLLPSGQLKFTITDCDEPLSGVEVTLLNPNGTTLKKTTEADGEFYSSNKLFAGTYNLNLTKDQYLTPDNQSLNFTLESDTSTLSATVNMPFRFIPVSEVLANAETEINVYYKTCTQNNFAGVLFYKIASQSLFTEVAMTRGDTSLTAFIPALNVIEEITYYTQVEFDSIKYSSAEYKITPKAAGILETLSLTPELNNTTLRVGDNYSITLLIRDGLQETLSDKFKGVNPVGEIIWDSPSEVEINIPDKNDPTEVSITPLAEGDYTVSVTAKLNGASVISVMNLSVSDIDITSLSLSAPNSQLSNRANGIQFSISGSDTSGRSITLGSSLIWDVTPRASISNDDYEIFQTTGFYSPIDSTFIGNVTISATDFISDLHSETSVSIFADIYPETSIELSDRAGAYITISSNSVNIPIQLKLNNTKIISVKKHITPKGEKGKFIVSDKAYYLSYNASTALPGDSLQRGGVIQIPTDVSLRFDKGKKGIAYYNSKETEWEIVSNALEKIGSLDKSENLNLSFNNLTQFGEYAIVSKNEPLGLQYLSVLPSPFSPTVAPVKIGYFLTSDFPPVTMDIKIYNMNGELIKTVLENDIQFPGRYGSSSSLKEITWDGITDGNNMARNGRYIIRLKAKDGKNEIEELIQVVLIK